MLKVQVSGFKVSGSLSLCVWFGVYGSGVRVYGL